MASTVRVWVSPWFHYWCADRARRRLPYMVATNDFVRFMLYVASLPDDAPAQQPNQQRRAV